MQQFKTSDGDTVDLIAWRYYGAHTDAILSAVYAANPGLAAQGVTLPAGVTVNLPDVAQTTTPKAGVKLWE